MTLQQLEQAFLSFRSWVKTQIDSITQKEEEIASCCKCKYRMLINYHNVYLYSDDAGSYNPEDFHSLINDKFPLDEICEDDKAILILNDATLYLRFTYTYNFSDPNSGWQIIEAAHGGKVK